MIIERVMMDGQELAVPPSEENPLSQSSRGRPDAKLRLPPGHRKLEFEFTALSFIAPENIRFRHRLEGLDEAWVEGGTERAVSYSRLPAGDYRFRVTACNNVGVWNEQDVGLTFAVTPFYWQTWWFRLGVGGSAAGGLWLEHPPVRKAEDSPEDGSLGTSARRRARADAHRP